MKDKHNVILILVWSGELNSLFQGLIKFLFPFVHLSFPEFQVFSLSRRKASSNHCKVSTLHFSSFFSFDHSFVYRSSSWSFCMMVHKGLNPLSKRSSRFFSDELKHSSSCNPECNSFYRIIGGGVMSFLTIFLRVSWFTSYQEWDILNPPTSSLELYWVIFHLKPSLRIVAIYDAYKWPKFFFYPPGEIASRILVDINPIHCFR